MADEPTDYSQIYDFVYRIGRRITYLEKDALFIENQILTLEKTKSKDFNSSAEELKDLRVSMSSLKNNFAQCAYGMVRLSKNMKDTVKKEEIRSLIARVDELQFEEYVTKGDLNRGL
jgi:hypothetical protein